MKAASTAKMRALALAALVVLSVITAPVVPAGAHHAGNTATSPSDGVFTPAVKADHGLLGYAPSEDVVKYGAEGRPGWVVAYTSGSADELEAWADASSAREIRERDPDGNRMVVSAPPRHVGLGLVPLPMRSSLSQKAWVEEIGVVREVNVDPIRRSELKTKDAWSKPRGGELATGFGVRGSFDADGAAWSDEVNETGLGDARQAVGADQIAADGSGITVAVLDTGLNYNQDLYGERVPRAYNALTNESVTVDTANATASDYEIVADGSDSRHGSWVTTAIAGNGTGANATGVAPGATIVPVKVLGDDGSGSTAAIARGLEYACEDANADVVSMSLGSPTPSTEIEHEIQECLADDGVSAVVVAAGNNRLTYRYVASPGDAELDVVTVAASDARPINESESAYFSAVGPDPETEVGPDVAAPGLRVTAEVDSGERTLSGTSMATPIVSGAIALLLEERATLQGEPAEVLAEVEVTAEPMPQAGETEVGAGRLAADNLIAGDAPANSQADVFADDAAARDAANSAHSGSYWRTLLAEG